MEVGKDVWKHLKQPSQMATSEAKSGIVNNTYYSGDYKFQISIPDDNWRFWKPTPQFIASLGTAYTMPVRDVPIIIMSKNVVKLYRPLILLTVEDVGSFTNVQELVRLTKIMMLNQGFAVDKESITISPNSNSAALIGTVQNPLSKDSKLYNVQQIFLYACMAYYISATYVPVSNDSPQLFGGMRDILNSFKLIK